jgi:chitinase
MKKSGDFYSVKFIKEGKMKGRAVIFMLLVTVFVGRLVQAHVMRSDGGEIPAITDKTDKIDDKSDDSIVVTAMRRDDKITVSELKPALPRNSKSEADSETKDVTQEKPFDFNLEKQKIVVLYFPTWYENQNASSVKNAKLAHVSSSVNVLNISFILPGAVYKGDGDLSETGLDYDSDLFKASLAKLKSRNHALKVLLSVGGFKADWSKINADDIARMVKDYKLDGVDIDYEPIFPICLSVIGIDHCITDGKYEKIIKTLRAALPRPLILSAAVWGTGAYGGDQRGQGPHSQYSGELVHVLKDVGGYLDLINIMAYNCTPKLKPMDSLKAYQELFDGAITVGVQTPPEWGGHVLSVAELHDIGAAAADDQAAGIMIWPSPPPPKDSDWIDLPTTLKTICSDFKKDLKSQHCGKD